jgi:uncharacterized damage-inducible protein DinB
MKLDSYVNGLRKMKAFFDKSTSLLEEGDSGFSPKPGMYTVANHVAHAAQTVDWFVNGAFGGKGFDMDFAGRDVKVRSVASLREARAWMDRAVENAVKMVGAKTLAELEEPFPRDEIMAGMAKGSIVQGIAEHTAHHRGALTVYARLLGKVPPMPYV